MINWEKLRQDWNYPSIHHLLYDQYWTKGKSLEVLALELGISHVSLYHKLLSLDIPLRSRGGVNRKKKGAAGPAIPNSPPRREEEVP